MAETPSRLLLISISCTSFKLSAPYNRIPCAMLPSFRLSLGIIHSFIPASFAAHTIGSTPLTGLTVPSRLNSPSTSVSLTFSSSMIPFDTRMPIAIGRSNPVPSFLISAGEILTTIRCGGNSTPVFFMAILTLSLASLTSVPRYPLISNVGSPLPTSVSTLTIRASIPHNAAVVILLNNTLHPLS